jgi:hydroxyacylglutathione hydrolase
MPGRLSRRDRAHDFRKFGFGFEIEPTQPDFLIAETPEQDFLGLKIQVLEVPGHCPGSLCFYSRRDELIVGGDVLFAGGVGRWDLPGGDGELLFAGIKKKLFPLGDNVTVLPGHGPPTKIGTERRTNPFLK